MTASLAARVEAVIRTVPDFPKAGIRFKDITPVLADPALMDEIIEAFCAPFGHGEVTHVVGVESRGFLFGVPVALRLRTPFVPARKPGKLPRATVRESFSLEYGSEALEIHADALDVHSRVLVVDDVLATGGTAAAVCRIVERMGATVQGISVLGEIRGLCDPAMLTGRNVHALVSF